MLRGLKRLMFLRVVAIPLIVVVASIGMSVSPACGASSRYRSANVTGVTSNFFGPHLSQVRVFSIDDVGLPYPRDIKKLANRLLHATVSGGRSGIESICSRETCTSSPADLLQRGGIKRKVVRILSSSHPASGNGQDGPVQIWPGFTFTGGVAQYDGVDMSALGVSSVGGYHGLTIVIGVCDGPSYQRWCNIDFTDAS